MRYRHYSDRDYHLGPYVTLSPALDYHPWSLLIDSGNGESEDNECHLMLAFAGHTAIFELPKLLRPWVNPKQTWDKHARRFGFTYETGFLQVFLGPQTYDSLTTKNWCTHLPWTQWRFIRHSLYDLNGSHFWTADPKLKLGRYEIVHQVIETIPKASFTFKDYDGTVIIASTYIEEFEWSFGEGFFSWLSIFRKSRVQRTLNIKFSAEVGPEKGSWKGGILGHGIEMLPGELHEDAFKRYCEQNHRSKTATYKLEFLGKNT
jgi:hypothetical protein